MIWHKTQRTTYEEDGSLLFEVDVDGIGEISWWIMGYGAEAEVLEPPQLRERMAKHVARLADTYAKEAFDYMVSMSGQPDLWQRNQFY